MPITHPTLRTARLVLEPLVEAHAAEFLAYYDRNRNHLEMWEPARPASFYTEEYQRSSIAQSVADSDYGLCARFVAFEPGEATIVANFNLQTIRRGINQTSIVGYSVDATRAGRGYASEILEAIVRYAFDGLGLHRLEASYQPSNDASARVLAKNGFAVEGYAREYLFLNGAWRDGVLTSLTNRHWRESD